MTKLHIRKEAWAGRITLTRPEVMNALSLDMVEAIFDALIRWARDDAIRLVIIDAEGPRAFCAGADVTGICRAAMEGDHDLGRRFFAAEYRMNALIANYAKPIIAFMQGYVMGGGVGLGGHASSRIVGNSTNMAMPEVGIGLIPDIGGTWLLARTPGRAGEYLGLTGARMGPGDAIWAGFADHFIPEEEWPDLIADLAASGDLGTLRPHPTPAAPLDGVDLRLWGKDLAVIEAGATGEAAAALARGSPLSKAAALATIRAARADRRIEQSLSREYRFTARATEHADFVEGVRAQLLDKDRNPRWAAPADPEAVKAILSSLGPDELAWPTDVR